MANKASLGSIIWVEVGASKAQSSVPRISSTVVTRAKSSNHSLSSGSSILSSLVSTTDIGKLIVDSVGDDRWVESLLLSLVDERVDGLESESGGGTSIKTSFELHGWNAESKVERCVC